MQRWRVMALSSGERTLGAHMAEGGRRNTAGQEARLLDVPATMRAHGAFDQLHGHADGRAFADSLKQAAGANYGHAGPAFIEFLIKSSHDLPAYYARTAGLPAFCAKDGLEARAAGVFALIAMAGELASEAGITGWPQGAAGQAAAWAYAAWREQRGSGQTEDRQILQAVRDFIARHADSRFSPLFSDDSSDIRDQDRHAMVRDRAGYFRDVAGGRVYLFNAPALREAGAGYDLRRILEALDQAGWIVEREKKGVRSKPVKAGGTLTRFYVICPGNEQ